LKGKREKMVATHQTSEGENENLQKWKRMFLWNKQVKEKNKTFSRNPVVQ